MARNNVGGGKRSSKSSSSGSTRKHYGPLVTSLGSARSGPQSPSMVNQQQQQQQQQQRNRVVSSSLHRHEAIRKLPGDDGSDSDSDSDDMTSNANLFTNKATVMANFEEWIKMATDNKINTKNSWNFALIDYFHDLNVLKNQEDGGINFQKASATLDGCMKIYSSRVDSVASETGKLLSGLATERSKRTGDSAAGGDPNGEGSGNKDGADNAGSGTINNGEVVIDEATGLPMNNGEFLNGDDQRRRRNVNRVLETTLTDFDHLKLKQLDEELAIDPLFKKALSEFDEAGAKSLLLNTLKVEEDGRVIFDAMGGDIDADGHLQKIEEENEEDKLDEGKDMQDRKDDDHEMSEAEDHHHHSMITSNTSLSLDPDVLVQMDKDIMTLGNRIMANIASKMVCPSMSFLKDSLQNTAQSKTLLENLNHLHADGDDIINNEGDVVNPEGKAVGDDGFLTENELKNLEDNEPLENLSFANMDDNNGELNGADVDGEINDYDNGSFHQNEEFNANEEINGVDDLTEKSDDKNENSLLVDMDILAQLDHNMTKSWRGREHWKVLSLKKNLNQKTSIDLTKDTDDDDKLDKNDISSTLNNSKSTILTNPSKLNEIDFFQFEDNFEEIVFGPINGKNSKQKKNYRIDLPLSTRQEKTLHLLPNDFHFTTDKITRLFIKPDARMSFFSKRKRHNPEVTSRQKQLDDKPVDIKDELQQHQLADEQFWAENYAQMEKEEQEKVALSAGTNIDKDGGNDHNLDINDLDGNGLDNEEMGFDFNYAFEDVIPGRAVNADGISSSNANNNLLLPLSLLPNNDLQITATTTPLSNNLLNNGGGNNTTTNLNTNTKVKYSRVSKRVDIKKLKDNIWRCIQSLLMVAERGIMYFSKILKSLKPLYSKESFDDISTSFCFICLLHLANEHGFIINKSPDTEYDDLILEFPSQRKPVQKELETRSNINEQPHLV